MNKINKISLLWFMDKNKSLEHSVKQALDAWNRRPETRDFVPTVIELSLDQTDVEDDIVCNLKIEYSKLIQKGHLQLTGDMY